MSTLLILLPVLACPLAMWLMMRGGHGHGHAHAGHSGHAHGRIRVRGGYRPDTIHARAGESLRLVFRREETAPCSERVVFPDLGKSAMLPAYRDVVVELRPEQPGVHEFTCELGVLHGRLVVEERS